MDYKIEIREAYPNARKELCEMFPDVYLCQSMKMKKKKKKKNLHRTAVQNFKSLLNIA